MGFKIGDRCRQTSTTSGTGDLTLIAAAAGFQNFSAVLSDGDTFPYGIDDGAGNWELGEGTFHSAGPSFSRTTVKSSSNSNALVSFSGATKTCWIGLHKFNQPYFDASGNFTVSGSGTFNALTATGLLTYATNVTAAFGTAGSALAGVSYTQTDNTTGAGTVAAVYGSKIAAPTFATAANAITVTVAASLYVPAPVLGAHVSWGTFGTISPALALGGGIAFDTGSSANMYIGGNTNSSSKHIYLSGIIGNTDFELRGDGTLHFNGSNVFFDGASTTASAANCFLNNASSNQIQRSTSSIRYKANVQYLAPGSASAAIDAMKPMTYTSLAKADDPSTLHYGLLAEDLAKVEPSLVHWTGAEGAAGADESYLATNEVNGKIPDGVQYERIVVLLLAEVQSLRKRLSAAGL